MGDPKWVLFLIPDPIDKWGWQTTQTISLIPLVRGLLDQGSVLVGIIAFITSPTTRSCPKN